MSKHHHLVFSPSEEKSQKSYRENQQLKAQKLEYNHTSNNKLTVDDLLIQQNSTKAKNIYDTPTFEFDSQINKNKHDNQYQNIYNNNINNQQLQQQLNPTNSLSSYNHNNNNNSHSKSYGNLPKKVDFTSIESDFDMSETKLNQLGFQQKINQDVQDYSNLLKNYNRQFSPKQQSQSPHQQQQDISVSTRFTSNRLKDHSKQNYEKYSSFLDNTYNSSSQNNISHQQQYRSMRDDQHNSNNNVLQGADLSIQDKIKSFQKKLQSIEENFNKDDTIQQQQYKQEQEQYQQDHILQDRHQQSAQDPYHLSIHTLHMNSIQNELPQKKYDQSLHQQEYMLSDSENTTTFHKLHQLSASQRNNSKTSLGSSRKPPISQNLNKVFGTEERMRKNLSKNSLKMSESNNNVDINNSGKMEYEDSLNMSKLKYYDTFLPKENKILNCPLKLLKYKMQNRYQNQIKNCASDLEFLNQQISNSLFQAQVDY